MAGYRSHSSKRAVIGCELTAARFVDPMLRHRPPGIPPL